MLSKVSPGFWVIRGTPFSLGKLGTWVKSRLVLVPDSPILKGYQIFHNYIRTHEGLEGKTPAEAAGITVEGENKWLTIIQNASKKAGRTSLETIVLFPVQLP